MRVVIDTSSLLALVRYYLPFDKEDSLKKFVIAKIEAGEIIILDKVFDESKYIAKGIIVTVLSLPKKKIVKTTDILPDNKFFSQLENQFCYGSQKNRLNPTEFEIQKNKFLDSADAKQILFCIKDKNTLDIDKPILVTEETKSENDNKLFKKLPEICGILEIEHCNLTTLFIEYFKLNLSKFLK